MAALCRQRDAVIVPAVLLVATVCCARASAGEIHATIQCDQPIRRAIAIDQRVTPLGFDPAKSPPGQLVGDRLTFTNLKPGNYDIRITLPPGGGEIWGWNAKVPPATSYDDEATPMSEEDHRAVLSKLSAAFATGFDDEVAVLDFQGNIEHAIILTRHLRRTPFVGGNYQPGEWVWRLTWWHYQNPEGDTWTPHPHQPFQALVRQRLRQRQYDAIALVMDRRLGGIVLNSADETVDLGIIRLATPKPGIVAVNPDGQAIPPVTIKP